MPVSRLATITEAPDSGVDTAFSHTVDSGATLLLVSFHCNAGFDYSGTATWSLGGGENLTELWNSPGVSFGDARCTVFGLVSPTSGAGTITIPHGSISETIGTGVNYDGTIITSAAAAAAFISEDVNLGSTTTTVLSSGGSSGNGLYAAASKRENNTASNDASMAELVESFVSGWGTAYVIDDVTGAPGGVTTTWSTSRENSGVLLELVAAGGGPTGIEILRRRIEE